MTEENYFYLLERIIKGAEYLSNPLIKPGDVERGMKRYDVLCEQVMRYQGISESNSSGKKRRVGDL
jgi:hypothetical protein